MWQLKENRSVRKDADNSENGNGRLRLCRERQRVVGRRMRNVFARVVVFRRMIVVMEDEFRKRVQDSIQMRRRGEMDGNVIKVEGDKCCDQ